MKKTFKMPVTWEVCGFVNVEADSIEDAIQEFKKNSDCYELPNDPQYVEDSFCLSDDDPEIIKAYNQ